MPWQDPKINWTPPDGVTDLDFNRIEGNILEIFNTFASKGWVQAFGLGGVAPAISVADMNAIDETGFYISSGKANQPDVYTYHVLNIKRTDTSRLQLAFNATSLSPGLYFRAQFNGEWGAWKKSSIVDPSFVEAQRAINTSIAVGTEYKVINFTEYKDTRNEFSYSAGEFTAADAGTYLFSADVRWGSASSPNTNWYCDAKTGGTANTPISRLASGGGSATVSAGVETVGGGVPLRLAKGDVVSFYISHSDTAARTLEAFRLRIAKIDD